MLPSLNIPSGPLPERPSTQPVAPGDAGERDEFAQLLQQANAVDGTGAHDEPSATSKKDRTKDGRTDLRVRPDPARTAQEHKPHDARRARGDVESIDGGQEASDLAPRSKPEAPVNAAASAVDAVAAAAHDDSTPTLDATPAPAWVPPTEPLPMPIAQAPVAAAGVSIDGEPCTATRLTPRNGAREPRLPLRADAAATPADANKQRTLLAPDIALPQAKEVAFDAALHAAGNGRTRGAPLFDRTPIETTPAAAQAMAFARELSQPQAVRAGSTTEAALQSAPHEAAFAPTLGAQVALWVKDGVQEARLHLHPAELGPVSVLIALEGQAAHIDFTAAVAATRESIEQSLPALAAALRESGFTLAGGGVFGGRPGSGDAAGREHTPGGRGTRGTAAIGTQGGEPAPTRRWVRSLVDVYA